MRERKFSNIPDYVIAWLEEWDQYNVPILYYPYRVDDCLVVLGDCTGVVVYPEGEALRYEFISEDDGQYFVKNKLCMGDICWMKDDIKYLETCINYIYKHGTPVNYANTNILCTHSLPWNENVL